MAVAVIDNEVKNLKKLHDGNAKITIPKRFVDKLGYKAKDELFLILYNDKLIVMNQYNFIKLKVKPAYKIKKTSLTGFNNGNKYFIYNLFVNKEYVQDLKIKNQSTPFMVNLKDYGLILSKYIIN